MWGIDRIINCTHFFIGVLYRRLNIGIYYWIFWIYLWIILGYYLSFTIICPWPWWWVFKQPNIFGYQHQRGQDFKGSCILWNFHQEGERWPTLGVPSGVIKPGNGQFSMGKSSSWMCDSSENHVTNPIVQDRHLLREPGKSAAWGILGPISWTWTGTPKKSDGHPRKDRNVVSGGYRRYLIHICRFPTFIYFYIYFGVAIH